LHAENGRVIVSSGGGRVTTKLDPNDITLFTLDIYTPVLSNDGSIESGGNMRINGVNGLSAVGSGSLSTPLVLSLFGNGGSVSSTQNTFLSSADATMGAAVEASGTS